MPGAKKRKRAAPLNQDSYSFRASDIAEARHGRTIATNEHVEDGRLVREDVAIPAPPPAPAIDRGIVRIEDILADGELHQLEELEDEILKLEAEADHHAAVRAASPAGIIEVPIAEEARESGAFATKEHDRVLSDWVKRGDRERYLRELLRLEGWRDASSQSCPACPDNRNSQPSVRCDDCFGGEVLCVECSLQRHAIHFFHRIKRWNGRFFERTTLKVLGLVIQLGHGPRERCATPEAGPRNAVVMHVNGFHPVNIQFCRCLRFALAGNRFQQALRAELFPATTYDPSTFCTFRLMEHFHMVTLQGKISAYDYYHSLKKLTDNTGSLPTSERFKPFLRMIRQWRHLKMLKRAGRCHVPNGIATTGPGDLCVKCPACPVPGFNLPENWETVADDLKYIYSMVIAFDANFRLRRRAISNDVRDPALGSGWGYFVENKDYKEHVLKHVDQAEMSTCTGFAALLQVNSRYTKGYAVSGVAIALDSRHGFILGNGIADLQKGERYCTMDYLLASVLKLRPGLRRRILSYDIVCQWAVNLHKRLVDLPQHLRIELPEGKVRYAIPKGHFRGHKQENHHQYSLNLIPGVGRNDGEEVERNWSRHNATANSTREMGPGSRHDTLEDHFGFANWQKLVGLGPLLKKRLQMSALEKVSQDFIFHDFCQELKDEDVREWTQEVVAWEKDSKLTDPYNVKSKGISEVDIRLQLAEEDAAAAEAGLHTDHEITPSGLIMALLDMEEQMQKFAQKYPSRGTVLTAEVIDKRRILGRRVDSLRAVQAVYMPCVPQLLARWQASHPVAEHDRPETQPLFFPSALSVDERHMCAQDLVPIESRLRDGQLRDALEKIRLHLHIKSRMKTFKDRNVRYQGANTRARQRLNMNDEKIQGFATKYRVARAAKLRLIGNGDWEKEWRVLREEDVRTLISEEDLSSSSARHGGNAVAQTSSNGATSSRLNTEGRRHLSWIWMAAGQNGEGDAFDESMNDALRIEFLKARARCLRFTEDIILIREEQRRTLVSLEKWASMWEEREASVHEACLVTRLGLQCYAAEQAAMYRGLKANFAEKWARPFGILAGHDELQQDAEEDGGDEGLRAVGRASVYNDNAYFADSDNEDPGIQAQGDQFGWDSD